MDNRDRDIRPGRNKLESYNKPVTVGRILVNPGEIVVADGDGVVVVPRKYAAEVAKQARAIIKGIIPQGKPWTQIYGAELGGIKALPTRSPKSRKPSG